MPVPLIAAASPMASTVTPMASMRDGRISHSLYLLDYDMRAHRFYITGTDVVEDPVSRFFRTDQFAALSRSPGRWPNRSPADYRAQAHPATLLAGDDGDAPVTRNYASVASVPWQTS